MEWVTRLFPGVLLIVSSTDSFRTASNVALNKPAWQYTKDPGAGFWSASNAVDGDKTCSPVDSHHFTLSGCGNPPWWQVDLGAVYNISRIKVYGRRDNVSRNYWQGTPFNVSVGNSSSSLRSIYTGNPNEGDYIYFIRIDPPDSVQIIDIRKMDRTYMTICEVKVFDQVCRRGYFGYGCLHENHCEGDYDMATGHCPICQKGWQKEACQQPCAAGEFGSNCSSHCGYCHDGNTTCDSYNGHCQAGCAAGYKGEFCKTKCSPGEYGPGCTSHCGQCSGENTTCNVHSGHCPSGCAPGYKGDFCSTPINVALSKPTLQYTVSNSKTEIWPSSNAVDGDKTCSPVDSSHFTLSEYGDPPWWQVDLGAVHNISRIRVYGRKDNVTKQLEGFTVHLSTSNILNNNGNILPLTTLPYPANGTFDFNLSTPIEARFCRLSLPKPHSVDLPTYPILLCEVEIFELIQGRDNNIIIPGHTIVTPSISSQYNACDASKSIDGSILHDLSSDDFVLCQRCSVALGVKHPWLQLDLSEVTAVGYIRLYGRDNGIRTGQSSNLTIFANNISITDAANLSDWTELGDIIKSDNINGVVLDLKSQRLFRYLTITTKYASTVMTICEVKLYTRDCSDGHFGEKCSDQCHCKHDPRCNGVTGECSPPGCAAGWTGEACNILCSPGKYGENCKNRCYCYANKECKKDTGFCPNERCARGWQSPSCNIPEHSDKVATEPATAIVIRVMCSMDTVQMVYVPQGG
ncbi:uncharacterized protein LOC128225821 [Mya arenaria]|uniref:uncharacterized protein LOC128225821 n=1 Tax=Mya arenaria TaxID=6604 RepID=UPI0022E85430|nr:uncharacterized protein LOC128225821 [Mya arenaria]